MDTFSETLALASRKKCSPTRYSDAKLITNLSNFSVILLCFSCRQTPRKSKFLKFFLSIIDTLVATFNETCAATSGKYVAEQDIMMPNCSKIFQTFRSHSSIFAWEKQNKNLNLSVFFTSNRPFGGYFQWNACMDSQKIYGWTRYTDEKLVKRVSNI